MSEGKENSILLLTYDNKIQLRSKIGIIRKFLEFIESIVNLVLFRNHNEKISEFPGIDYQFINRNLNRNNKINTEIKEKNH